MQDDAEQRDLLVANVLQVSERPAGQTVSSRKSQ